MATGASGTTEYQTGSTLRLHAAGATHVGLQRSVNEDAYATEADIGLYVVCDGMGGHASGQIAAQLAIDAIIRAYRDAKTTPTTDDEPLVVALKAANTSVYNRAQEDPLCHGMGTTAVAVAVANNRLCLAHCGDSRVYQLRAGELRQLTRDHSLANLYEDRPDMAGKLGPATSNVIVRAIGLKPNVVVDHQTMPIEHGDRYLLCCDGLSDLVEDAMIRDLMESDDSLARIADRLVAAANRNGGTDNITVILLDVFDESQQFPLSHQERTRPGY